MKKRGPLGMKKYKRIVITLGIFLGLLVTMIVSGALYANYLFDSTLDQMVVTQPIQKEEASISQAVIEKEEETSVTNIAVFGLDRNGDGSNGRSDAMKVLSLDTKNKTAKVTSLQRDTLIYIPGEIQDFDKLNHAYAYGGAKLAMQTINYNFDLDLTRYVTFDFDAIEFIIDSIGGVDIEVLSKEISSIPGVTQSGIQTLSGSQALSYMRIRYADSDYVRMSRQTTVMKAIFAKLKETSYTKLLTLLNESLPFIETNLTKEEILNLGMEALKVDFNQIEQYQIPQNGYEDINHSVSYKGYSPLYVLNSYGTVVKQLHEGIYGDSEYEPSTTVLELEASIYEKFGYVEN